MQRVAISSNHTTCRHLCYPRGVPHHHCRVIERGAPHNLPKRTSTRLPSTFGQDAVDGWLDVAALVSSGGSKAKSAYSELSYAIGRDVYVDVAGWHLYFRDLSAAPGIKTHDLLANVLGPQIGGYGLSEKDVVALLKKIPIKLGGGKLQVALHDIVPQAGIRDLVRITEDFAKSK